MDTTQSISEGIVIGSGNGQSVPVESAIKEVLETFNKRKLDVTDLVKEIDVVSIKKKVKAALPYRDWKTTMIEFVDGLSSMKSVPRLQLLTPRTAVPVVKTRTVVVWCKLARSLPLESSVYARRFLSFVLEKMFNQSDCTESGVHVVSSYIYEGLYRMLSDVATSEFPVLRTGDCNEKFYSVVNCLETAMRYNENDQDARLVSITLLGKFRCMTGHSFPFIIRSAADWKVCRMLTFVSPKRFVFSKVLTEYGMEKNEEMLDIYGQMKEEGVVEDEILNQLDRIEDKYSDLQIRGQMGIQDQDLSAYDRYNIDDRVGSLRKLSPRPVEMKRFERYWKNCFNYGAPLCTNNALNRILMSDSAKAAMELAVKQGLATRNEFERRTGLYYTDGYYQGGKFLLHGQSEEICQGDFGVDQKILDIVAREILKASVDKIIGLSNGVIDAGRMKAFVSVLKKHKTCEHFVLCLTTVRYYVDRLKEMMQELAADPVPSDMAQRIFYGMVCSMYGGGLTTSQIDELRKVHFRKFYDDVFLNVLLHGFTAGSLVDQVHGQMFQSKSVTKIAESVEKLSKDGIVLTHNMGPESSENMKQMTGVFQGILDEIASIRTSISKAISETDITTISFIEKIVGVVATVMAWSHASDMKEKILIGTMFGCLTGIASTCVESLLCLINMFGDTQSGIRGEIGEDKKQGIVENAFTGVVEVCRNMFKCTDENSKKIDSRRIKIVTSYWSLVKCGKDFIQFVLRMFQQAFYFLYEKCTGLPYNLDEADKQLLADTAVWLEVVHQLMNTDLEKSVRLVEFRRLVGEQHLKSQKFAKDIAKRQLENGRLSIFMDTCRKLDKIKEACDLYEKSDQGRPRPVVLSLAGLPLTGKTNCLDAFIHDLCYLQGRPYSHQSKYPLKLDKEFWDGYDNQFCCTMDDVFQDARRDMITDVSLRLVDMANDATYLLPMADLPSKGKKFFDSPLIILTSNKIALPDNMEVQDKTAILRRRDFLYEVDILPQYCKKGLLNGETVVKEIYPPLDSAGQPIRFSRDIYRFRAYNPLEQTAINANDWVDYYHVLEQVSKLMKSREVAFGSLVNFLKKESTPEPLRKMKLRGQMWSTVKSAFSGSFVDDLDIADAFSPVVKESKEEEKIELSEPVATTQKVLKPVTSSSLIKIRKFFEESKEKVKEFVIYSKQCLEGGIVPEKSSTAGKYLLCAGLITLLVPICCLAFGKKTDKPEANVYDVQDIENLDIVEVDAQGAYKQYNRMVPTNRRPNSYVKRPAQIIKAHGQVEVDLSMTDVVTSVVGGNYGILRTNVGKVNVLFIKERWFVTCAHAFRTAGKNYFKIDFRDASHEFRLEDLDLHYVQDDDVVFVNIKSLTFPNSRDISGHFVRGDDLTMVGRAPIAMCVPERNVIQVRYSPTVPSALRAVSYKSGPEDTECQNLNSMITRIPTKDGECGSAYMSSNKSVQHKLIGIHVAGGNAAICSVITYEDLIAVGIVNAVVNPFIAGNHGQIGEFDVQDIMKNLGPVEDSIINLRAFDCANVRVLGTVDKHLTVRQPRTSEFVKSSMYGEFHIPEYAPAMLAPTKTGISPYENGLAKKLLRDHNVHDDPVLQEICECILDAIPCTVEPRILTRFEAINGVKGWNHVGPIDTSTSSGWPKNVEKKMNIWDVRLQKYVPATGKRGYLVWSEKTLGYELCPQVNAMLDKLIDMHQKGEKYPVVVCDNLKDELLPHRKVRDVTFEYDDEDNLVEIKGDWIGNTRIMNSLPLEALVEERMLFGAMFEEFVRWKGPGSFCGLGFNAHSFQEVETLINKFNPDNSDPETMSGDAEKQDASQAKRISDAIRWICIQWYKRGGLVSDEQLRQMETADIELSEPVHIAINVIYSTFGNPSGRYWTTPKNSLDILIKACLTAVNTARARGLKHTVSEIVQLVIKWIDIFGDDHVLRKFIGMWFDMFDMRTECARWGMGYTGAVKEEEMPSYYSWDRTKYLQRFFRKIEGQWHMPLDKKIIEDIPYWYRKSLPECEALPMECESACREAYHWGREYFYECKSLWNKALAERGYKLVTVTYDELDASYFGSAYHERALEQGKEDDEFCDYFDPVEGIVVNGQMEADPTGSRSPIEAKPNEIANGMVAFTDDVGIEPCETEIAITPVVKGTDPYMNQAMKEILSRWFIVAQQTWASSDAFGTAYTPIDFPHALVSIPMIQDKLNNFQMFRSPVEIEVRLNTTAFFRGQLLIQWVPHYAYDNETVLQPLSDIWRASMTNFHILSADSGASLKFCIPFTGPSNWWNMSYYSSSGANGSGFLGVVKMWVLVPLGLMGASSASAVATVFARFSDPEVAGFTVRTGGVDKTSDDNKLVIHGQMSKNDAVVAEAENRTEKRTILDIGKNILKSAWNMVIKPVGMVALKALPGIIAGLLNMPTSLQNPSKTRPDTLGSMALVNGQDNCDKLALDPANHVAHDASIFTNKVDYGIFLNYIMLPFLFRSNLTVNSSTSKGQVFTYFPLSPTMCYKASATGGTSENYYIGFMGNVASNFELWRGSINILIKFSCYKYISARIRVGWLPDPAFATFPFNNNQYGNMISNLIDVQGDTDYMFSVPMFQETHWLTVPDPETANNSAGTNGFCNGMVFMDVINPPVNSSTTGDSNIYINIFVAGGSDMKFARMTQLWPAYGDGQTLLQQSGKEELILRGQVGPNESIYKASDIRETFKKDFPGIVPYTRVEAVTGIQNGEEVSSWYELLRRYSFIQNFSYSGTNIKISPYAYPSTGIPFSFTRIARAFRSFQFVRGSFRWKMCASVAPDSTTHNTGRYLLVGSNWTQNPLIDTITSGTDLEAEGNMFQDTAVRNFLEVETPYYTQFNMTGTGVGFPSEISNQPGVLFRLTNLDGVSRTTSLNVWAAAGDDLSLGYPINPVILNLPGGDHNKGGGKLPAISKVPFFLDENYEHDLKKKTNMSLGGGSWIVDKRV